jgi:hypothetical protein
MPNWCFNRLEVSKHSESGRKLIDAFRDNHVNEEGKAYASPLTDLHPCPKELLDAPADFKGESPEHLANKAKYGHADWYSWRLANWGTKWEACEVYIEEEDDEMALIRFDSAWCPPTEFFEWYAQENPDVVFLNQYDEEGCGFEGYECHSPARGFVQESWEPRDNRIPEWCDLVDEIPEGEAHSGKTWEMIPK